MLGTLLRSKKLLKDAHALPPRPRRPALNSLFVVMALRDAVDEDAGGVDGISVELADFHELLDLRDANLACGRHHGVKVAGGLPVDEVAGLVALPRLHDAKVGD